MVAETRGRRLWWRHLISVLIAPVTMTLVIPAQIVDWAHVRMPDLGSPLNAGLVTVGGLLIAGGLGLLEPETIGVLPSNLRARNL